jgi:hypothetical protein
MAPPSREQICKNLYNFEEKCIFCIPNSLFALKPLEIISLIALAIVLTCLLQICLQICCCSRRGRSFKLCGLSLDFCSARDLELKQYAHFVRLLEQKMDNPSLYIEPSNKISSKCQKIMKQLNVFSSFPFLNSEFLTAFNKTPATNNQTPCNPSTATTATNTTRISAQESKFEEIKKTHHKAIQTLTEKRDGSETFEETRRYLYINP